MPSPGPWPAPMRTAILSLSRIRRSFLPVPMRRRCAAAARRSISACAGHASGRPMGSRPRNSGRTGRATLRPRGQGGGGHGRQWRHRPRHGARPRRVRRRGRDRRAQRGQERGRPRRTGRASAAGNGGERRHRRRHRRGAVPGDGGRGGPAPRPARHPGQQRRPGRREAAARDARGGVACDGRCEPDQRRDVQPSRLPGDEARRRRARSSTSPRSPPSWRCPA